MKRLLAGLAALAAVHLCPAIELETFSAKGDPRTMGVDFSIGRPKAWMTRNAMNPGALTVFWKAPTGLVDSMTIIFPRTQSREARDVTKEDFRETFENPALEQMFLRSLPNATFLRKTLLEDFKYPAGHLEYIARYRLATGEVEVKVRNYLIYLGSVMMQIQFYLVPEGEGDRLQDFDAAMKQIIETLAYSRP